MARYRILSERSHVWFDARSSLHPIHSGTDGLEGYVELDFEPGGVVDLSAHPSGRLTLPVSRLSSGSRMEDRELQRRIEARRYPTIEGVLDKMERSDGDGRYDVSGEVTFRGVSRKVKDEMTVAALDDETVQLAGRSRFDIRDFGMEPPRMLMLKVEPEVDVRVEIVAVKEA
jgi:polyisoprenoid-binding protein YceI